MTPSNARPLCPLVVILLVAFFALPTTTVAQTPVIYGQTVSSSLVTRGQIDIYIFAGTVGEVITVRMTSTWAFQPQFEIYSPDGGLLKRIAGTNYYGTNAIRLDTLRLKNTGTYSLFVMDDDGLDIGSYSVHLQRVVYPVGGGTITYGQTVTDSVKRQASINPYTFPATSGEVMTVRMTSTWAFQPQFEIYSPDGGLLKRVAGTNYYGTNAIRLDTLHLKSTGTYSLFVMDDDGLETGSYSVYLQRTTDPVGAKQISHDQPILDTLKNLAEIKPYWFGGISKEILTILMTSSWGFAPQFEVYSPEGELLKRVAGTNYGGTFSLRLDTLRLQSTGTYSLFAMDDDGLQLGNFTLTLVRITRAWAGSLDSSWNNAANWYPSGVPTPGDSVVIGSAFRYPVIVVPQSQVTIGSLNLGAVGHLSVTQNVPRFQVTDFANVNGTLDISPPDTFAVQSEMPGALLGTGKIPQGTIQRSIRQSGSASYRFESDSTYVRFSDPLSTPSLVCMTTYPDTLPTVFATTWTPVPSRVFVQTHTVQADGVQLGYSGVIKIAKTESTTRLSTRVWAIKIPRGLKKPSIVLDGDTFIHRVYSTSIDGDATARVSISLRYDPSEIPAGVAEDSLQICWSSAGPEGAKPDDSSLPLEFTLFQNYPNPFNPTTEIRYQVPGGSYVKLAAYDLLGREVARLVDEVKAPGSYSVRFDGSRLASGAYFYRLTAGSFVATKSMVIVK